MSCLQFELNGVFVSGANASRDEVEEDYRFGKRFDDMVEYLVNLKKEGKADLIFISEGRLCKDASGEGMINTRVIANRLSEALDMNAVFLPNHMADDRAFNKIVLYNERKLFCLSTRGIWPSEEGPKLTPDGPQFCQSIFELKFHLMTKGCYAANGKYIAKHPLLTVAMIHNPVSEVGRDIYFDTLIKVYEEHEPTLMMGDFNIISDLGGPKHQALLETVFTDRSKNVGTTFEGFPHDVNPETGFSWKSSLDRVMTNKTFDEQFDCQMDINAVDMVSSTGRRCSDHYIIMNKMTFSF